MKIRKGDTVYIIKGANRGRTGKVLHVDPRRNVALVEGINMKKRHQRPTQKNPKGGIITIEAPISISNIALYSSTLGGPTKASTRVIEDAGKQVKVRVCRQTGEQI